MVAPINMSLATAVLLGDGWHTLTADSLGVVIDPYFIDPTSNQAVTPGEPWFQFTDDATPPQVYAGPVRMIQAVKLSAAV